MLSLTFGEITDINTAAARLNGAEISRARKLKILGESAKYDRCNYANYNLDNFSVHYPALVHN